MAKNANTIDKTHLDPGTAADDGEDAVEAPKELGPLTTEKTVPVADVARDTDVDGTAADVDESDGASAGRNWRRPSLPAAIWRRAAVGLVVVVAVSATVAAIVLGMKLRHDSDVEAAGQEALRIAEEYAVVLTSVDTQNLDRDFGRVLDGATGEFKDMYSSSSAQLRQLLVDNQATGSGTVVDAAIKSESEDKVEVLLFVDQSITNIASPDPRIDRSRIVMTMERVDGRWLASKVELP